MEHMKTGRAECVVVIVVIWGPLRMGGGGGGGGGERDRGIYGGNERGRL